MLQELPATYYIYKIYLQLCYIHKTLSFHVHLQWKINEHLEVRKLYGIYLLQMFYY